MGVECSQDNNPNSQIPKIENGKIMAKNIIKGSSDLGYTVRGKKVTNAEAVRTAKADPDYHVYKNSKGTIIIRSNPDKSKKDNVNHDK